MEGSNTTISDNLMDNNNNKFKTAYLEGKAGTYTGTLTGVWATLKATSTVKGVQVTSLGTPNAILVSAVAGSVTITAAQAANISNSGLFITLFDSTGATGIKVVKYSTGGLTDKFNTSSDAAYANEEITDKDFFIIMIVVPGVGNYYYNVVVTIQN